MDFLKIDNCWVNVAKIERIKDVIVDNSIEKVIIYFDSGGKIASPKLSGVEVVQLIEKFNGENKDGGQNEHLRVEKDEA